jgi:hypothetical protein
MDAGEILLAGELDFFRGHGSRRISTRGLAHFAIGCEQNVPVPLSDADRRPRTNAFILAPALASCQPRGGESADFRLNLQSDERFNR